MKPEISVKSCSGHVADIHIAGCSISARNALRQYVMKGLCVSVIETDYIYTGGYETGVTVRLINYARFPVEKDVFIEEAINLGMFLIEKLFQSSCSVVVCGDSHYLSRRNEE